MSVTVVAVPFLFINPLLGVISVIGASAAIANAVNKEVADVKNMNFLFEPIKDTEHVNINVETVVKEIISKEIKTGFVDKDTLIKTLEEHGAAIITESDSEVFCRLEQFSMRFYKKDNEKGTPYTLKVECSDLENFNCTMEELGEEYTANAQEASYNIIKQRLEEKHLTIDSEEIYDDDTIVLTVNLE